MIYAEHQQPVQLMVDTSRSCKINWVYFNYAQSKSKYSAKKQKIHTHTQLVHRVIPIWLYRMIPVSPVQRFTQKICIFFFLLWNRLSFILKLILNFYSYTYYALGYSFLSTSSIIFLNILIRISLISDIPFMSCHSLKYKPEQYEKAKYMKSIFRLYPVTNV